MALKNLVGQKFGKLMVIERAENDKRGEALWRCRCDCGNEVIVRGGDLRNGHTTSCGCLGGKFQDLAGQKFGRLTVIARAENNKRGRARWLCRCECGNECIVLGNSLISGNTHSCGCLLNEIRGQSNKTHGMSHSKIFKIWCDIKKRCFTSSYKYYVDYGGRGITLYPAWINDFQSFYDYVSTLEHFGEDGMTLDRIDNDGNYEPGNLRWISRKMQTRNRRNTIIVEYNGEKMALAEAAERSGINYDTLFMRFKAGDYERGRLFRPVGSK